MVPALILIAITLNTMSCGTPGLLTPASDAASATATNTPGTGAVAFVSNFAAGTVASYKRNTKTGVLTRTAVTAAGAKNGPRGLAFTPSGNFLYVANRGDNNIYGYSANPTTGVLSPPSSISNGSASSPDEIAINPAGTFLFVTGFRDGTVTSYSINAGSGQLTQVNHKVIGLSHPWGIAVNSAGTFLFVADNGSGLVYSYSINTSTGVLTKVNSVFDLGSPGGTPGFIALDPGGSFIYVTDQNAAQIAVLGVSANGVLSFAANVPGTSGGEKPLGIGFATTASSGNFIYTANQGTSELWSSLAAFAGSLSPPVAFPLTDDHLNFPTGLVVDPQNLFLYTTNQGNGAGTVSQFSLSAACIGAGAPCFVGNVSTGGGANGQPFGIILAN